jgi:integrase
MMGQVFQRTYRAADGAIKKCATWTIRYCRNGRPYQEATSFTRKTDAQNLLKTRMGDIVKGVPVTPAHLKLTLDDAAKDVINDFTTNGKRSIRVVERRINKYLLPYFRGRRMSDISASDVRAYVAKRQADTILVHKARVTVDEQGRTTQHPEVRKPVSNAEINRELQILKRCFSLALQAGKLHQRPHIPMLRESPPRSGFFERSQFEAVQAHLPAPLRGLVGFASITGWRVPSEVQPLERRQVDFAAGTVRLDPGQTKNGEGRLFPMTAELRAILEEQREYTEGVQREKGAVVPFVFHRNEKPSQLSRRRGRPHA